MAGRHHVMFMARGTALEAYIDRQRMASVPEISTAAGLPSDIEIRLWAFADNPTAQEKLRTTAAVAEILKGAIAKPH